jgi:hypothetical protein
LQKKKERKSHAVAVFEAQRCSCISIVIILGFILGRAVAGLYAECADVRALGVYAHDAGTCNIHT